MEKNKQEQINIENLLTLNIGMVGHIDHGKTTLLWKLTGKWADTHSEELKRGITIKLGYADTIIRKEKTWNIKEGNPERYVTFIDAPGHEMLMATMLSGAAMIDAAILVIAANEGIKPQTREHLIALDAKKIKNIIIVQNKIDLVSREKALESYKTIKEFVKGTIAENSPIIPCSAQQEVNIDKIFEELCKIKIPERDTSSEPLFMIARSFDVNRPGSKIENLKGGIIGGTMKKGKLKIGDEIEIKPGIMLKKENQIRYESVKSKITNIYKGSYPMKEAEPGGSLAIETELDPILTKADNLSGCVAGLSGKLPPITSNINLKFTLFKEVLGSSKQEKIEPLKLLELLMLSVNTSITVGVVRKIRGNILELSLRIPIVPFRGENIGLARNLQGHWRLIGYGEVL
ncbi:translation initiation factor IF-2 subunit gamma [Candidatus Pacearchaeota archaeon]|nr:translation initiation factor IF-2 subunit gamma [Candidatus Pacearchaeota archaeon]